MAFYKQLDADSKIQDVAIVTSGVFQDGVSNITTFFTSSTQYSNTGDYRIIDKKIKNVLITMRERTRFLRGLISYIGFKQTGIFFDRPIRKKGKSKSSINW